MRTNLPANALDPRQQLCRIARSASYGATGVRMHDCVFERVSPVRVICDRRSGGESALGRAGQVVPAAQGAEELIERRVQGVGEGVPGLQRADGAVLLDLDDGASGQAAAGGKLVIAPPARGPQAREFEPQRREVRIGR